LRLLDLSAADAIVKGLWLVLDSGLPPKMLCGIGGVEIPLKAAYEAAGLQLRQEERDGNGPPAHLNASDSSTDLAARHVAMGIWQREGLGDNLLSDRGPAGAHAPGGGRGRTRLVS
jgi:hypothetical protein